MVRSGAKPLKVLLDGAFVGEAYRIQHELARGNTGAAVYLAEHAGVANVAVKFPVSKEELRALLAMQQHCLPGVLRLTAWGKCDGAIYAVMPLLGAPVSALLERLQNVPPAERWTIVGTVGRLLLRSLQGIHRCGIVHCDVQPNNILVGQVADAKRAPFRPFFIDFDCARPFPGGPPMKGTWGSLDFNSIRSASGGERGPHDDLESLGWVLCHAFVGELPWFACTREAWELGMWEDAAVTAACRHVEQAKQQVRSRGWSSFGERWGEMPQQLGAFLHVCWERRGIPDYWGLAVMLGGKGVDAEEMEEADLSFFNEEVVPLLDLADLLSM